MLPSRTLLQVVRQGGHRSSVVIGNGAIGTIIADLRKPASTRHVSVRLGEMSRVLGEPTTHAHGVAGQRQDGDVRRGTRSLQRRQRVAAGDVDSLAHGTLSVTSSVMRPIAASAGFGDDVRLRCPPQGGLRGFHKPRGLAHRWGRIPNLLFVNVGQYNLVLRSRMRTLFLVAVALASSQGTALQPERTAVVVKAWSSTAGPYGALWILEIGADGAGSVTRWRAPDEAGQERHFTVAPKDRSLITKAIEDAKFFELPEFLGPPTVPLHGPENTLQIELDGRVRKVTLHDPSTERGAEVERFKRAWRAVVKSSPLKPPL